MRSRSWLIAAVFLFSFSLSVMPGAEPASAPPGNPGLEFYFSDNFETVLAPALPAGWTATQPTGQVGDPLWMTSTVTPYDYTNAAYTPTPAHITDNRLDSPAISVVADVWRPALVFWHSYDLESNFDGGVVEIKIGAGAFTDIITAGGRFLNNGYTGTISVNFGNPLAGRQAFTGSTGGAYVRTVIAMPPAAGGQTVQIRFRVGTDSSASLTGWHVDNVRGTIWALGDQDFNGDLVSDRTIYRPSNNVWYTALTNGGSAAVGWGTPGDVDVSADYDGDGKNDVAVWRPSTGAWFIVRSSNGTVQTFPWGQSGDIPMGGPTYCCSVDASADATLWRPGTGTWFIRSSVGDPPITFQWGTSGDQPLIGDYAGIEWVKDLVIYRPTTGVWYVAEDGGHGAKSTVAWGAPGDIPVVGDWDGDGRDDVAVFRPSSGQWWIRNSHTLTTTVAAWGVNGDIPIAGDFNADGRSDFTVWRPSNGVWYTKFSNTGGTAIVGWGVPGDQPIGRRSGS